MDVVEDVAWYCHVTSVGFAGSGKCWECLAYDVSNEEPNNGTLAFDCGSSEMNVQFEERWDTNAGLQLERDGR